MNLRKRVLLTIGLLVGASILATFVASQAVFTDEFRRLEREAAEGNLQRALNALDTEAHSLSRLAADWATWDDAYNFALDRNQVFIDDYFVDNTFQYANLNLILIANSSGELVYGEAYDLDDDSEVLLPEGLAENIAPGQPLTTHLDTKSEVVGLLRLDQGPMLIASRPIVTSQGEGPIRGALLMGRYFDERMVSMIGNATQLSVWVRHVNDTSATSEHPAQVSTLHTVHSDAGQWSQRITVDPLSENSITAFATLNDLAGSPITTMGVDMPRDIYRQGLLTIQSFLVVITIIGLSLLLSFIAIMNRSVLSPVSRISKDVYTIGLKGDLSARLVVRGRDELSKLSATINRMLSDLDDKNRKLQEMKSRFISAAAHELKTPLVSIRGYADLMTSKRLGEVSERVLSAAKVVSRNASEMQALVTDLLDIERIETGVVKLKREEVDLAELARRTIQDMKPRVESKKQDLELNVLAATTTLRADGLRVQQVLSNLLSNAAKFTPNGGRITVTVAESRDDVLVSVQDTGIGIAKEHLAEVFEPFTKIPKPIQVDSTGLGLSITKRLVAMHGGRIWVESSGEGKGATFHFTLPRDGIATEVIPAREILAEVPT